MQRHFAAPDRAPWYITTSIPYVNAPPHLGFALEAVQADALARFHRQRGYDVRFLTGTDENSLKNVRAAAAQGVQTETLVARNAAAFARLRGPLALSFDDFIRTSVDPRHRPGVQRLWSACAGAGDLYKRAYRGLYCVGFEQFYRPAEVVDGVCPEHGRRLEEVAEENYFFRLSRFQGPLTELIETNRLRIEPEKRRTEVLRWLEAGLEDFSVSRVRDRSRGWGIPVPGDPSQVIYVWFDALGNYITALDYAEDGELYRRYWREGVERIHVIGKGITRFHALYWPAMLLSAGVPLPSKILVHGYVTVAGCKIGKSLGNVIDPVALSEQFGPDAVRYYLLRHVRSGDDTDFTFERLRQAHDSELADQLGNLARRALRMLERYCDARVPATPPARGTSVAGLQRIAGELPDKVERAVERFALHDALGEVWQVVRRANRYVNEVEPAGGSRRDARTLPSRGRGCINACSSWPRLCASRPDAALLFSRSPRALCSGSSGRGRSTTVIGRNSSSGAPRWSARGCNRGHRCSREATAANLVAEARRVGS